MISFILISFKLILSFGVVIKLKKWYIFIALKLQKIQSSENL